MIRLSGLKISRTQQPHFQINYKRDPSKKTTNHNILLPMKTFHSPVIGSKFIARVHWHDNKSRTTMSNGLKIETQRNRLTTPFVPAQTFLKYPASDWMSLSYIKSWILLFDFSYLTDIKKDEHSRTNYLSYCKQFILLPF